MLSFSLHWKIYFIDLWIYTGLFLLYMICQFSKNGDFLFDFCSWMYFSSLNVLAYLFVIFANCTDKAICEPPLFLIIVVFNIFVIYRQLIIFSIAYIPPSPSFLWFTLDKLDVNIKYGYFLKLWFLNFVLYLIWEFKYNLPEMSLFK